MPAHGRCYPPATGARRPPRLGPSRGPKPFSAAEASRTTWSHEAAWPWRGLTMEAGRRDTIDGPKQTRVRRPRQPARQRLHQRSRRLRLGQALAAVAGRRPRLHRLGHGGGVRRAPSRGCLSHAAHPRRLRLRAALRDRAHRFANDQPGQGAGLPRRGRHSVRRLGSQPGDGAARGDGHGPDRLPAGVPASPAAPRQRLPPAGAARHRCPARPWLHRLWRRLGARRPVPGPGRRGGRRRWPGSGRLPYRHAGRDGGVPPLVRAAALRPARGQTGGAATAYAVRRTRLGISR